VLKVLHKEDSSVTTILKIDQAMYEFDDKTKTYGYFGRNPDWKNLTKEENQKNKKRIDGYTRMFPDGRKIVFRCKG
jgi:hypothetical protein